MSRNFCLPAVFALAVCALLLPTPPATAQPETMPTHLVQISLLAAAKTGPNELADLPANTREAIEDVRQFLPYKSYRLLDTALLRAQRGARTSLTGPDNRDFSVAFTLDARNEPGSLLVRAFDLQEKVAPAPPAFATGGDKTTPVAPGNRTILSSSFTAEIGQTVVVGTSRLNGGDEAMIVLFTALP